MTERISTLQVRKRLGEMLDRVALRNDQFVIERRGRPLAALVPIQKFEGLEMIARKYLLTILERQRGSSLTEAQANALAQEAVRWARRTAKRRRRGS